MVCLGGTLLCPAASWGDFFSNMPFTFSFAKVFLLLPKFSQLVSFTWNSQKCTISQNIWCLIKTPPKKNITQTFFQGGSPWATLIHNSMVCLGGTLLCPHASWGDVFQTFPLPFSFAKVLFFYGISMVLLLDFYGIPMGFPWCFYDISGGFLWDFWRDAMGLLWCSYGISIGFLWDFYGISMMFLWYFYGVSIGFLWNFYWIPVGFPRYFHDVSMIFLWDYYWNSHGISLWFLCYSFAKVFVSFAKVVSFTFLIN